MGAATSQSAILGNLGVKGSGQVVAGQKDREHGTDSNFLSILESVSGVMMVPSGSLVLQPDKGSKKPVQDLAVDSVKQAKAKFAILNSKPGAVGGSMDGSESKGTRHEVASGSAAKDGGKSVSQVDSIAIKDASTGGEVPMASGSEMKDSSVLANLEANPRAGLQKGAFPDVQTLNRSGDIQPRTAKPAVNGTGKLLNVAQIPLQKMGETWDSQLESFQAKNTVVMQHRELSKQNVNTTSAQSVQKLYSPLQVQLASNLHSSASDSIAPEFVWPQSQNFSNQNAQSDLKASGKANIGNVSTTSYMDAALQMHTPLQGELQNLLPVSNGKMVQDTNQPGTGVGKKGLSVHNEVTGIGDGANMTQFAALHMQGSQPVHSEAQSASHVTTLDTTQPNWTSNFGQIVSHVSNDNGGTIQVKVHPEGMGDLLISVSQSTAGLQIHVEANQLTTAQWLGQQTGQLTNAVSQLGISVANVQVGFGQATLGQSGNGHSNRKSGDGERQVQSVTGPDEGSSSPLLAEPGVLGVNMPVYSSGSSILLHA